ncbi:hypothetical protein [Amycolatopsis regifaucium]|nr:hypothetical protein [Amycolatopsis regifaucium]
MRRSRDSRFSVAAAALRLSPRGREVPFTDDEFLKEQEAAWGRSTAW